MAKVMHASTAIADTPNTSAADNSFESDTDIANATLFSVPTSSSTVVMTVSTDLSVSPTAKTVGNTIHDPLFWLQQI